MVDGKVILYFLRQHIFYFLIINICVCYSYDSLKSPCFVCNTFIIRKLGRNSGQIRYLFTLVKKSLLCLSSFTYIISVLYVQEVLTKFM